MSIAQHQYGRLERDDAGHAPGAVFGRATSEIADFTRTDNLHAIGMDVVEMPHQIGAGVGLAHGLFIKAALRRVAPGNPLPAQDGETVFEQLVGADGSRLHAASALSFPALARQAASDQSDCAARLRWQQS